MSTRRLVIFVTFLAVFTMSARLSVDTDTWWHLRAGRWMVENRSILTTDQFSYTRAGEPWQYPGWLVEIPMYFIHEQAGPGGLNLWTAVMVTLAFYFVWRTMKGGVFLRAFILILAATTSGVYWSARPHLVTILFGAIFLFLLERYRENSTVGSQRTDLPILLWLPIVMILWVNAHGGFMVGFLIWGVYWITEITQRVWGAYKSKVWQLGNIISPITWVGIVLFAAVCVNPSGPVMLLYPFKTVSIEALQEYIQEWHSPNFHSTQVQPFAWLILLSFGIVGASKQRLLFTDFALFSGFAYMGLLAGRNIALFALVAPIVLARHLEPLLTSYRRRFGIRFNIERPINSTRAVINSLLCGVLLVAAIIKICLVYPNEVNVHYFTESLPVSAVKFIQSEKLPGNLFNSYNWGGYLLWAAPEHPVFVDGRTDLYNDEIIRQWLQVVRAEEDWQRILEKWQVNMVLLEINLPIVEKLEAKGWDEVFRDDKSVVFVR